MRNEKVIDIYTSKFYTNFHGFKEFMRGSCPIASLLGYKFNIVDSIDIPLKAYVDYNLSVGKRHVLVLGSNASLETEVIREFKRMEIPFTIIGRTYSFFQDISTVSIDFKAAAADMVELIINSGRKRIAFVGLNTTTNVDLEKLEGFKAGLAVNSISFDRSCVFEFGCRSLNAAILDFCSKMNQFDAVVCSTDAIAILLMKAASAQGIDLQEQLAITGFDNLKTGSLLEPGLTTVKVFFEDYGKAAVNAVNLLQKDINLKAVKMVVRHCIIPRGVFEKSGYGLSNNLKDEPASVMKTGRQEECFHNDDSIVDIEKVEELFSKIDAIEIKILKMLVSGMYYKEIAAKLFVAEATIKYRIKKMLAIVKAESARELLVLLKRCFDYKQIMNLREDVNKEKDF